MIKQVSRNIYITGFKVFVPGIVSQKDLHNTINNKNKNIKFKNLEFNNKIIGKIGVLKFDDKNKFFPAKPDLKIMRSDVLASTICIQQLVNQYNFNKKEIQQIDLYIANGNFVENLFDINNKIVKNFKKAFSIKEPKKRQQIFFRVSPPLLALNTLTNATESYNAQYTGIASNNTTFGNTSMSGFYALQEAVTNISAGKTSIAVVGASNRSGIVSFLTNKKFMKKTTWTESPGAVYMLLESEKNVKKYNRKILGKITHIEHSKTIPSIFKQEEQKNEIYFIPKSNTLFYSAPFSENNYIFNEKWKNIYTLDKQLGSTGSISVLLNIVSALTLLKKHKNIDCIDIDPYNRKSFINISK